jgi:Transposase IS66 family
LRWEGLTRFLGDGRIEIDSNVVERAIRPIAKIISSPAPTAAASISM